MKNLSIINKLLFVANSIAATALLLSLLNYFISPNAFLYLSFLSLTVTFLIIVNIVFVVYWILKLKKQFLVSTLILLISFSFITKFYGFSEKKILLTSDVKIMSYNVRMFNLYKWIEDEMATNNIYKFIKDKNPDILCIQEFHPSERVDIKYPYKYVNISEQRNNFGQAIFSKYKIINSGSLNFTNSSNNAIFADIIKNKDTIRIYNIHLESLKLSKCNDKDCPDYYDNLSGRIETAFKKQNNQVNLILEHQKKIKHTSIIAGDFNNTAYSWMYNALKKGKNDAFEIAGEGFGKTFDNPFPFRIDFILADEAIEINNFKTFNVKYSDHYPIMARINFNKK